uniref:Thiamine pyrimidine synthase n=1 Tax=Candidatus Kentrum sp. FW TaxID=2126338 RepID=A0A450SA63_9GAMM|nr:MAG: NMT1/THI5 like [Candidatus Kentron sp. FW]
MKGVAMGSLAIPFLLSGISCSREGEDKNQGASHTSLRMQSPWINDAEFIGYFIAMEKGFYKEAGIDFEYLPGGPEIVADSVLLAKRSEVALTTPDVTVNAIVKQNAPFKIIGAQYQKNPLGVVSLKENNVNTPQDLIGKTLAAPPANHLTVKAFLKINEIPLEDVRVVPYQYDPTPLLNGEVDATLDFVTNVPYTIQERGGSPSSFLLYDFGFRIFNDTVVVRDEMLEKHRELLTAWLLASRRGWEENFKDPSAYPPLFKDSYFSGTGRSVANEIFFNKAQRPLMENPKGIYAMSEEAIEANIRSLAAVGINATRDMFVNDLL